MKTLITNPNQYGILSEERLSLFEKEYGINLPEDYRSLLLQNNGGHPYPSFFWIDKGKDGGSVQEFFGVHEGPEYLRLPTFIKSNQLLSPGSLLFIGGDGLGNFICLGMNSQNWGSVYFIDHDLFRWGKKDLLSGINKLSNSFSLFFDSLEVEPE